MPDPSAAALIVAVALCVAFNFVNGFHDAANTIATSIATRALTVPAALVLAGVMNFLGALVSHKVAFTMATGVIAPEYIDAQVVTAACFAAVAWNLATWWKGVPSSSSHALVAGLLGAGLARAWRGAPGGEVINWTPLVEIVTALFTSPLMGFIAGFILFKLIVRMVYAFYPGASTRRPNRMFARLQPVSAALMSFAHGSNDAQKTMGLIALLLYHHGVTDGFYIPFWVTALCAVSISLGTMAGGYRIIKTVAKKITDLQPVHGFCAEIGSASVMFGASALGMPVSTTHVAVSSVVGVGASKTTGRAPRGTIVSMINAWLVTIPVTMAVAGVVYFVFS